METMSCPCQEQELRVIVLQWTWVGRPVFIETVLVDRSQFLTSATSHMMQSSIKFWESSPQLTNPVYRVKSADRYCFSGVGRVDPEPPRQMIAILLVASHRL